MTTDSAFPTPANLGIAVYSNNAEAIGNTLWFVSIVPFLAERLYLRKLKAVTRHFR